MPLRAGRPVVLQLHYHPGEEPVRDQTRVELELADSVALPAAVLPHSNRPLVLPPGQAAVDLVREHAIATPGAERIAGARVHMHRLGTAARLEIVRGDHARCLLAVPRWEFEWQLMYFFHEPFALEPGDRLRVTCSYDTRARSEPVRWGPGTDDEMCIGYVVATR
jgi:hypothetical protein